MHATKTKKRKAGEAREKGRERERDWERARENPGASLFISHEVKRCSLSLSGCLITVPAVAVPRSPARDRSHFQPRCCDLENIWLPLKLPHAKSKERQRSWTEKFFPPPSPLLILSLFLIQAGANAALQKRLRNLPRTQWARWIRGEKGIQCQSGCNWISASTIIHVAAHTRIWFSRQACVSSAFGLFITSFTINKPFLSPWESLWNRDFSSSNENGYCVFNPCRHVLTVPRPEAWKIRPGA